MPVIEKIKKLSKKAVTKPHVSKQDVEEARGKKRKGLPRPIKTSNTSTEKIHITPPMQVHGHLLLIGDSPLITNCWSWKSIQSLLRQHLQVESENPKSTKKPKDRRGNVRDAKDPYEIFINSLYEHRDGGYGFPSNGIKRAMISACSFTNGISPKYVAGAITIHGELSQILGTPKARFDMVTVTNQYGKQSPDTRFRAQFDDWAIRLNISYASSIIAIEDIINLLLWAGAAVGIGEWRKEKDGNNGMFHVASNEEARTVQRRLKIADRKKMNEETSGVQEILSKYKIF